MDRNNRTGTAAPEAQGGTEGILSFLADIARHNNREWFQAHRDRYEAARQAFAAIAEEMIARIGRFEPEVAGMPVESTLYRFYRDTRFSPDKSPYKRHFGTYINPRGKKSPHGGYYLHLEPGNCLLAGGAYCLEMPLLRAVRQSIVDRTGEFRAIVEDPVFRRLFPVIGESRLKTVPAGFPRDFAHPEYIRPKDYSVCHRVPDDFFRAPDWPCRAADVFRRMKPFLDFVNDTIDDYC